MDKKNRLFSFAAAFALVMMVGFQAGMVVDTISVFGTASASDLGDNITSTLGEWIPLVLILAFVGIALGYLGIKLGRK